MGRCHRPAKLKFCVIDGTQPHVVVQIFDRKQAMQNIHPAIALKSQHVWLSTLPWTVGVFDEAFFHRISIFEVNFYVVPCTSFRKNFRGALPLRNFLDLYQSADTNQSEWIKSDFSISVTTARYDADFLRRCFWFG